MDILLISHFDAYVGPKIFLKIPESDYIEDLEQICKLMDIYENGFFIHVFKEFSTYNLLFSIPSPYARGNVELLMISYVSDFKKKINSKTIQDILNRFKNEFNKISEVYKAFSVSSEKFKGDLNKIGEIKHLLSIYYELLISEIFLIKQNRVKLFILGFLKTGKTTLIKNFQEQLENGLLDDNITRVYDELSILNYDIPDKEEIDDLWTLYLKNQDGIIYMLDVSQEHRYEKEKELIDYIINFSNKEVIPFIIILNKIDLIDKHKLDSLIHYLGINKDR